MPNTVVGHASGRPIERFKNYFEGSGGDTGFISVDDVEILAGFNSRNFNLPENRQHLDNLKVEIVAYGGIHTPVKVRFDADTKKAYLLDGESRYRAVMELNEEAGEFDTYLLLATAAPKSKVLDEAAQIELSLSANTGKPFAQWEVGSAYEKLILAGRSVEKIAKRFSKSERYVRDAVDLAPAPDEIKIALSNGDITVAVALKALRNKGNAMAVQAISQAVSEAKESGTGKVKAQYTKRNTDVKVPIELLKQAIDVMSELTIGNADVYTLSQKLLALIPSDKSQGQAAKELDEF